MKILIISHEYPPIGGGGANACMYLAREYAKNNHAVDIVTVWYEGLQEKEIIDDYSGTITIYRVKAKRSKKESCGFAEMRSFQRMYCRTPCRRRLRRSTASAAHAA